MAGQLTTYNSRRDFRKTPEPEGGETLLADGLRFAVQHHMARRDHFDLRLEWGGVLLSWAVPKGPSFNTRDKRLAVRVEDHPMEYRHFEGTIPQGEYGGGTVMLWDEGVWEPQGDVDAGLQKGALKFVLDGRRLKGKWALVRLEEAGQSKENWLLLKEKDSYAQPESGIEGFTHSIRTGRSMEQIGAGGNAAITRNPFDQTELQLARLAAKAPEGDGWLFELKYDGYRIVAFLEGNAARLVSRNGHDYAGRFRPLASALLDLAAGRAMVLDGEAAVLDGEGKTDFQALQNYLRQRRAGSLVYLAFDLLALDGQDLRGLPLTERKEKLRQLMENVPPSLHYSRHVQGNGQECFAAACRLGMEGVVGKRADSPYRGGRNGDWIKVKCQKRQELVVGGFTQTGKTAGVSALLLGIYDNGELVYAGRAGTGFTDGHRKDLERELQSLIRANPPFQTPPKPRAGESMIWLEPKFAAEVQFAEWTEDGRLRQASFKGLRADKDPKEIRREAPHEELPPEEHPEEEEAPMEPNTNGLVLEGVKITNPDKVIFDDPVVTKADVARYYAQVSQRMLPYVANRVLSIVRCPKGISQACFYKKHPGPESKGIVTVPIVNSEGVEEEYFCIRDAAGLVAEAQMGSLEFHIWGSKVDRLEMPDMMVFDLDPDEGMDLTGVRQGVLDLRGILEELGLRSYLKTSGGKGYHVVVPLLPAPSWDAFHAFARRVAEVMEAKWPDRYTSNVRKNKRSGKTFIDWMRNGRGATSIAPYSIRARKGAGVSMPIAWEELDTTTPSGIGMQDALRRIAGEDPWAGFFQNTQGLK